MGDTKGRGRVTGEGNSEYAAGGGYGPGPELSEYGLEDKTEKLKATGMPPETIREKQRRKEKKLEQGEIVPGDVPPLEPDAFATSKPAPDSP